MYIFPGYGNIVPCSIGGRIVTVVYTLFSIPLALITLEKIGKWLTMGISFLISKIRHKKASQSQFALGILLVLAWILISAGLMLVSGLQTSRNGIVYTDIGYMSSLYFTIISLTTVGLGDVNISNNDLCLVHFAIIFVGETSQKLTLSET